MTDPNTPTTPTNPQDLIDQALGNNVASNPVTTTGNEPASVTPAPALPTPEPLSTPPVTEPVVEQKSEEVVTPNNETVPVELTNTQIAPDTLPKLTQDTKPVNEDLPLAFIGTPTEQSSTLDQPDSGVTIESIAPVKMLSESIGSTNTITTDAKPKKKGLKVVGIIVGSLFFIGMVGFFSYNYLGNTALVAYITKWVEVGGQQVRNPDYIALQDGKVVKDENGDPFSKNTNEAARAKDLGQEYLDPYSSTIKTSRGTDSGSCGGCFNNQWQVWENGQCKLTGSCGTGVAGKDTANPNIENASSPSSCQASGGTWCAATDMANRSYAFCNGSANKTCQTAASEKGYSVLKGAVLCKVNAAGTGWEADDANINYYWDGKGGAPYDATKLAETQVAVDNHCDTQFKKVCPKPDAATCQVGFGSGDFICQVGKAGSGGDVYQAGQACTAANGFPFKGSLGCFCGVVQMDTPMGHTSYSSTCGCGEKEAPSVASTPTPSSTPAPTLMCDGLTRTPTTTPAIGDNLTFTCAGSSVPTGSVSLTYKFRYSLNSGSYISMTNATPTTANMTIAACGSYKVQCQACGTINGVLTCDPNWTGATTQ